MSAVTIRVDRERCQAAGMCVLVAPGVFDQDTGDGRVRLLLTQPPARHHATVREAVEMCPSGALTLVERDEP